MIPDVRLCSAINERQIAIPRRYVPKRVTLQQNDVWLVENYLNNWNVLGNMILGGVYDVGSQIVPTSYFR